MAAVLPTETDYDKPEDGAKETSLGSRGESTELCTQGRRAPCISMGLVRAE